MVDDAQRNNKSKETNADASIPPVGPEGVDDGAASAAAPFTTNSAASPTTTSTDAATHHNVPAVSAAGPSKEGVALDNAQDTRNPDSTASTDSDASTRPTVNTDSDASTRPTVNTNSDASTDADADMDADAPKTFFKETADPLRPTVDDEYAATRERIADPDDWRLDRKGEAPEDAPVHVMDPEEEARAKRFRTLTHVAAGIAIALLLATLVAHFASLGPRGMATWLVTLAAGAALGAIYAFPRAQFPYPALEGDPDELRRVKHVRALVLRGMGMAFGLTFAFLAFMDFMALLVAVGAMADLSQSSLTLARNFVLFPVLGIGLAIAGVYVRIQHPSKEDGYSFESKLFVTGLAIIGIASAIAAFLALGLPSVVRATQIEARQGIYVQGLAVAMLVLIANLKLRIPNVVQIVRAEIANAEKVDRSAAQDLQRRMVRNYVMALVFVIGSIGFLVSKAAGVVATGDSGGLDLILLVYLGFGLVFLTLILTNYYQAKQLRGRIVVGKKGETGPGKRRFTNVQITRYTLLGVSGLFTLIFLTLMLLVGSGRMTNLFGIEVTARAGTDLFTFAVLSAVGPYGFYHMRETGRIGAIDEKFPDFLRDLAESQRAGMTLPRALITASKGVYGPLTKEIKIMAAQVEWGVSFDEALGRFAQRTRTPLIERTVSLVREAAASGGNVVDVLSAASDDAREIKNIMTERKAQMGVYSLIVYIAFGVFLTVIGVLNSQFIPELAGATSQVAGTSLGGIQFGNIDVGAYQQLFFHAALIQGIGGGLVSGVMTEGHPLSGLRHSFIMTLIAYSVFRFAIL